jgi:hypothetical protein
MIDFIKKPADGSLPLLNLGSHPTEYSVSSVRRFAKLLGADEFRVHQVREDCACFFTEGLDVTFTAAGSPDAGVLLRKNVPVARVVGLPLTREIVDAWQKK